MKRILSSVVFTIIICICAQAQVPKPVVDERTELLSVVFRLVGAKEYVNNGVKTYDQMIDSLFAPFKDHELIKYATEIRKTNGIGYDAVMSFAINLEINDGKIDFRKNLSSGLESRWTEKSAAQFLEYLNDFYTKSKFHEFYLSHKPLYLMAEERFTPLLDNVDFTWFEKFYGKKIDGSFHLILSMCNGGGNYGPNVIHNDGREDLYSIMGLWQVDSLGNPVYPSRMAETVIHEYNHSYCNPLIDEFYPQMEKAVKPFYELVTQKMQQQAYGNPITMMRETLVRASVIEYFIGKSIGDEVIKNAILREQMNGFLFVDTLVQALSDYEKQRDKYHSLRDFMPEIVKLINSLSYDEVYEKLAKNTVKITAVSIPNNADDVDPKTTELKITFSKPMDDRFRGLGYGKKGKDFMPEFEKDGKTPTWNEDKTEITFYSIILKPNTEYSLSIPGQFFRGKNADPVLETYFLDFKTNVFVKQ